MPSKKRITFTSTAEMKVMQRDIINQAERVVHGLQELVAKRSPYGVLAELRFEKTVTDEVFHERMNFEEYLNQTFTYLVCLYAGIQLMDGTTGKSITIHFGNLPGTDVYSTDGDIACECFAAVSVKNNDKLKKEVLSLHNNPVPSKKYVFFYTHSPDADRAYIERVSSEFEDVRIVSIPFESLTKV